MAPFVTTWEGIMTVWSFSEKGPSVQTECVQCYYKTALKRLKEVNTIPWKNCNTVLVPWSDQRYRLCTTWLSNSPMEIKSTVSSKQYNLVTWDLRSSETLCIVEWQFLTDVSEQPTGLIFKELVYQNRWPIHEWTKPCYYVRVSLPALYAISETGKEGKGT